MPRPLVRGKVGDLTGDQHILQPAVPLDKGLQKHIDLGHRKDGRIHPAHLFLQANTAAPAALSEENSGLAK